MKRFVVLSVLLLASAIHAQVINALGGRTANPPLYFSGTNCRAWGFVQLSGEQDPATGGSTWVQEVRLYIGGTLVKSHEGDGPDSDGTASEWAVFDSTHFPNGALEIKFECTCSAGHVHTSSRSVAVKNRSLIANYSVVPDPPPPHSDPHPAPTGVAAILQGQNYDVNSLPGMWSANTYFNQMVGTNTVFVFAHGNKGSPGTSNAAFHVSGNFHEDTKVFGWFSPEMNGAWVDGYDDRRPPQLGTGLPPYNSSANPPTNLLWLWSCRTGNEAEFHRCLFPYYNVFSNVICEDQAYVGFTTFVAMTNVPTEFALTQMMDGCTIYEAREIMKSANMTGQLFDFVSDVSPASWRHLFNEYMPIRGDYFAKIKGVYTGDNTQTTAWYL